MATSNIVLVCQGSKTVFSHGHKGVKTLKRRIYDRGMRLNIDIEFRHYIWGSKQKFTFLAYGGLYSL
jgi:hypothetical protein